MRVRALAVLSILLAMTAVAAAQAVTGAKDVPNLLDEADALLQDPGGYADATLEDPLAGQEGGGGDPRPGEPDPGFSETLREAFRSEIAVASALGAGLAMAGALGFALVTRYVSPKEALKNPQRAMLYGYIRATPGAHLKQLSEEFGMKSSSILWHVRKLESADLVRSDHANGFRVFFPVEGGIELRQVSRAVTALQNRNAKRAFEHILATPGATAVDISRATGIHGGTVRWHLRKLRDFGLVEETDAQRGCLHFPTPLGQRALVSMEGAPAGAKAPQGTMGPAARRPSSPVAIHDSA